MQIAIDGPAASGKSVAARLLAKRLGFLYIDTGAMYRAVTLEGLKQKVDFKEDLKLEELARNIDINVRQDWNTDRGYRVYVDGIEVTKELFTPEVDDRVSITARIPGVRKVLVEKQRQLARENDVVMAGRDIGSNVLKNADVKIFLTASDRIRAIRRQDELKQKGIEAQFEKVLKNLKDRDRIDSTRLENPLVKTEDAMTIDNSGLTINSTVDAMAKELKKIVAKPASGQKPGKISHAD